ncbi:putative gustatory receptor 28a isoform X2 [Bombus pyrosoma]|uniref:putative gustatory receptor 28a isoform X2 n=1 Tax=Bombus pyrosoma TaxID=396416 RepID=UPI001CB905A0|nr:putative gustatory receptor 28a isoform X2 [Bombus pyrosoma]
MFNPKTLRQTIVPSLVMNFLFGMGISDVLSKKPSKLIEYTYTLCVLILVNVGGILMVPYFNKYYIISMLNLSRVAFKLLIYANIWTLSTLIIASRLNAQKLRTLIALVESNDQAMEKVGLPRMYRALFMYQIKIFVVYGFITVVFVAVTSKWHFATSTPTMMKLCLSFVAHVPFIVIYVSSVTFGFWVTCLRLKLHQLNQLLHSMLTTMTWESSLHKRFLQMKNDFENNKWSFRNEQGSYGNTNKIRSIKQMHLEIIKIVKVVNDTFGMQILLLMTTSIIFTITFLYILYRIIWLDLTMDELIKELVSVISWFLVYASQILHVNHVCAKTNLEVTTMGDVICDLYEPSTNNEFRAEIRNFTLQLIQNPVVFTAHGYFNLDHTFIQAVIGTITTYLIIMIQVGDVTRSRTAKTLNNESDEILF